jgi:hypothetical protein
VAQPHRRTARRLAVNKYGKPPAGSRVFIRTCQLINGWQDQPKDTNAIVPRA